ncbi:MAG: flagella basal body P-ring formation protein FlgA [Acidobacteriia bacterium]|nr:flagella basal body P-ring formation protein FlgA [Terriglobia bacterium]
MATVLAVCPVMAASRATVHPRALDRGSSVVLANRTQALTPAELIPLANDALAKRGVRTTVTDLRVQTAVELRPGQQVTVKDVKFDQRLRRVVFLFGVAGTPPHPPFQAIAQIPENPEIMLRPAPPAAKRPPVIRAGQRRTLIVQGRGFQFTVPALCLGSGAAGEKIRVVDPQSKKIYVAEILNRQFLKAVLQ